MKTNNSDIEEASDPDVTAEIEELFEEYQSNPRRSYSIEFCSWRGCLHHYKVGAYNYCDKQGIYFYDGDPVDC